MKKKVLAIILICIVVPGGFFVYFFFFRYPNTLPMGSVPEILLPFYEKSHIEIISGYGQITPESFHNGIDFGINATTNVVAPHDAYISELRLWFNEKGGHWQVTVRLWLNYQWEIELAIESFARNETYGQIQLDAMLIQTGQYVAANQTLGPLFRFDNGAHIHFMVSHGDSRPCPYNYLTPTAKATFEALFLSGINYTSSWCM